MAGVAGDRARDRFTLIALCLVVIAIVFGGGGTPGPVAELIVQMAAVICAAAWLCLGDRGLGDRGLGDRDIRRAAVPPDGGVAAVIARRGPLLIAMLAAIVPLVQLAPLPSLLWQALPGREAQAAALHLVGAGDGWRPMALSPDRTLAALLALGPPLLAMMMVTRLDAAGRRLVILAIFVMGLLTVMLGALQLTGGEGAWRFHPSGHGRWLTGFQANRNATADLLLIAMMAGACVLRATATAGGTVLRPVRAGIWAMAAAANALLVLALVLTGSRTGLALLAPAFLVQAMILWPLLPWRPSLMRAGMAGAALALPVVAMLTLTDNVLIRRALSRFAFARDFRQELWADAGFAAWRYWPVGAGMGGFVPAAIAAERLEVVDPTLPNRAHNDYLELVVESGIAGPLCLLAIIAVLAVMLRISWRTDAHARGGMLFALGALAVIALHSMVDYPLRSMAIACLAGVAAGLLAPLPDTGIGAGTGHRAVSLFSRKEKLT